MAHRPRTPSAHGRPPPRRLRRPIAAFRSACASCRAARRPADSLPANGSAAASTAGGGIDRKLQLDRLYPAGGRRKRARCIARGPGAMQLERHYPGRTDGNHGKRRRESVELPLCGCIRAAEVIPISPARRRTILATPTRQRTGRAKPTRLRTFRQSGTLSPHMATRPTP